MNETIVLVTMYDLNSLVVRPLHASLKEAGFNVNSIFFKCLNPNNTMDPPTSDEINTLIKLIKELEPVLVGINVRSTLFKLASKITEEIKKEVDTLVIWGGVHPTIRPYPCLEFADIVCIGEGEEAMVELATKISKNEEIDNIRNLWIKKGDKIIRNYLRPLIQNLDLIPLPDFSNENKYLLEDGNILPLPSPQKYPIITSRGCPFSCTFCCNNTLRKIYKDKGKYLRRRSVDNVIEELVQAKKRFNLTFIDFWDDVFTFDIGWIRRFCVQYKNNVNIPFFFYTHPKMANEEMIKLLKEAGATGSAMGIQSGSEEIRRKYFERYGTNDEIVRSARILHKYKINCEYDVIIDNPLETNENSRETLNLLLKLPRPFELLTPTLTHFPETKLTNFLLEKRIISENDVEDQKQESYERWTPSLDLRRNKKNLFWDNLYYLAKKKHIPPGFVIWLSHINFLKRYPKPLTLLLRLTSSEINTIRRGSKIDIMRRNLLHLLFDRLQLAYKILAKLKQYTPLQLAYKISAKLKQYSKTYSRFVDFIKNRPA